MLPMFSKRRDVLFAFAKIPKHTYIKPALKFAFSRKSK